MRNLDPQTVDGFGDEWSRFDQGALPDNERAAAFEAYFRLMPWDKLPPSPVGFDLGCGSGRWAELVASRVQTLHCIDASDRALDVARVNLSTMSNCVFHHASVEALPLPDESMDFGYSLGVLHHVPDTAAGIRDAVSKLKRGAPFLVYLYHAFDNRPAWYRKLWKVSDIGRRVIRDLPNRWRYAASQFIAGAVYLPLARSARALERLGVSVEHVPLSAYRNRSFYSMRTDALDRFGTALEQRFTRPEIENMMRAAGLDRIAISDEAPYWCAIGFKA